MSTQVKYTPLTGGMNLIDSQLTIPDGMLTECMNFEQIFGKQGYSRIDGYERFDGRLEPHNASYSIQYFTAGTAVINVGDIVTGPSASGDVQLVELASGSWAGGDATGRLILGNVTGSWTNGQAISVGVQKATAYGATQPGNIGETLHTTYLALAVEDRRAAIAAVPGSGPVRGIGVLNNVVYAIRDVVGGTSATLWKSSISGWTSVRTGLYPGGRYKMLQANFTGATTSLYLFCCNGIGRPFRFDGTTLTFMPAIFSTQATSTTSIAVGTGSKAFTCTETSRGFVAGQEYLVWSTSNAANWMRGTFTSYATNVLTINVTSSGGSGTFTDWEIGLANFYDKPYDVEAHKDHLFLSYPQGQLQTSNLGDPMTYSSTAALIGVGDTLSGIKSIKGGVMAIYCASKVLILEGSDKTTWKLTVNSLSSGAVAGTLQEIAGSVTALDGRKLTSLQATQAYGSFEISVFSRYVSPYMEAMAPYIIASRTLKNKNQYRLYASNGIVLTCTLLTPNPVIQPQDVAFTRSDYNTSINCVGGGSISGEDYYFFGTTDGYVMREDVGTSFDGAAIQAVMRLPFSSFKSPSNKKRFRKLVLDIDAPQMTTIKFKEDFDYSDGNYKSSEQVSMTAFGEGGQWNTSSWNAFRWSAPLQTQAEVNISGVGRNMSLLLWHESALDNAFQLQGLLIHYSMLGLAR